MPEDEVELFWEELFQWIDERRVVPIIGQDLLVVQTPSGPRQLYRYLAEKIAAKASLSAPSEATPNPLHALAAAYVARERKIEKFYDLLRNVLREAEALPLPEPLLQLAALRNFSLFITTTFDPFLARAIDAVRFGGVRRTEALSFSPYGKDDLGDESATDGRPTVFHLLGKMSLLPEYAVTEEDTLEFVHALQGDDKRPKRLFDELERNALLLIGNGFSDWLARFLLRTAKRERLFTARRKDFVSDLQVTGPTSLASFLHDFSSETQLYAGSPIDFVAQLSLRWSARQPAAADQSAPPISLPPMRPGAVFVSYASEDTAAAHGIASKLQVAGIDVWFDRVELQPGDAWERKILLNIKNASAFVPIISRNTLVRKQRFFREEWSYAAKVAVLMPPSTQFIFPIVIDDTPRDHADIPEELCARQWVTPETLAQSGLLDRLLQTFRAYES